MADMIVYCTQLNGRGGSEAVYALLEHAFKKEYRADLPEIKKTSRGKPYFPGMPDIHFSLSHTKTHVLCVISDCPVGCDIESPREISERALGFFCSAEELSLFDPLDLWVLKESYIKLFGQTIAALRGLRFSRDGGRIIVPDTSVAARLYSVGGCRAAVCCQGNIPVESIQLIT